MRASVFINSVCTASQQTSGKAAAFWHALAMILVSETGDETFIIAAVMAMRHPKVLAR